MKTYPLKNELVVQVDPVDPRVVQDHLFRHAFGVEKELEKKPWDDEGFGALGIGQDVRDAAFLAVRKLYEKGQMCGFEAVHGRPPVLTRDAQARRTRPCDRCPASILAGCVSATTTARSRYLELFEELVAALAHPDAVSIGTTDLARHSLACLRKPTKLEGLVVGRLGLNSSKRDAIFRIVRSDGLQVDLYFRGQPLTFRTFYRDKQLETFKGPLQFLQKGVLPIPGEPLSERALVSRPFWEGP